MEEVLDTVVRHLMGVVQVEAIATLGHGVDVESVFHRGGVLGHWTRGVQVEGLLSVSVVDTVSVRALSTKYKPLVLTGILQKQIFISK